VSQPRRQQLHLVLPYKFEPREHPRVAAMLDQGWRVVEVTRVTDRETLITFEQAAGAPGAPA
jgi:hypothetical protein